MTLPLATGISKLWRYAKEKNKSSFDPTTPIRKEIHRRQNSDFDIKRDDKPLSYFTLFRYATVCEKNCIGLAIFLAILSGCVPPIINVLYGEFCNLMIDRQYPTDKPSIETLILPWFGGGRILKNASISERNEALREDSRAWGLGCTFFTFLQFLSSIISVFLLSFLASQQVSRIRILFFKSVLCKDMAWFETRASGNFAEQTSENLLLTQRGIAEVLTVFTFQVVVGVINIFISFVAGWMLSTVLMMFIIPVFVSAFIKIKFQSKLAAKEMASYTKAGNVAEEVFTFIRTVVAFKGENKEVKRYSKNIKESEIYGIKRGLASGISNGLSWFVIYCSYAAAFVFGVRLLQISHENDDSQYTPAVLLIVFFGILTALTNVGFASSHVETFSVACGAAASVYNVISTTSEINPCSDDGSTRDACNGEIEFRNVHFVYPSRPSIKILKGINLKIKPGEVVAIVGGSGAGKSTILQLVQRFYDPLIGEIFLDGQNIKSLKVSWLRNQFGVVGQEPLLFSTTVRDNIWYGHSLATDKDIENAAKEANAHSFIIKLKEGYDTMVGQKGSTLSGGQKQRIAIARALVRNPKVLLLDEATSALDPVSEKMVQEALNRAAKGRTTLIVTHRLSTIVNASRIIVLDNGVIVEYGTHDELVAAKGFYKQLLDVQVKNTKEKPKPKKETPPFHNIYEDSHIIIPPGPRSRNTSIVSLSRYPQSQSLESLDQYRNVTYFELLKWSKPEWFFFTVGILASVIGGAALPVVCVLFGSFFEIMGYSCTKNKKHRKAVLLNKTDLKLLSLSDFHYIVKRTDFYGEILIGVGVSAGICVFLQMFCFSKAGIQLSNRLRVKAFSCMIQQEIGYFDDEKNKVGALCFRLSNASTIQKSIGIRLGILMQACSTMTIGVVLSFFFDWKITMVTLATIPFVFTGVYLESVFAESLGVSENKSVETASKIAVEVIGNIKAVASLSKESFFIEKYTEAIMKGRSSNIKKSWLRGFAFAIGQTAPFFGYALTLWYGGILMADENLHYKYVIMISELLIFGAWTLGQSLVFGPSFSETKAAAGRLSYIFLRQPKIVDGNILPQTVIEKDEYVKYSNVHFSYPIRPGTAVLEDFSMSVNAGESVAVMGASGSGKSTIIQLLQRLYDPTSGSISVNQINIKKYRLSSLRKTLGLVSQEPVLFDRTIQENIAYGDNSREVSRNEIIEAAKAANIHSFIVSLPLGYDTVLGGAGTQLSGGQKQRIAIARALVRNPQILLLDEATSALDPQSENTVQNVLDKASSGRTTITIAHRLGAVRNADKIFILDKGSIKEYGTHEELMSLRGIYYSMHVGNFGDDGDDGDEGDDGDDKKNIPETSEE